MRNFLVYWVPEELQNALKLGRLLHAGGTQLKRIAVSDRLWICGRVEDSDELLTVGFIDVAQKLTAEPAQAEMYKRIPGYRFWAAPWHVFAEKGAECPTRLVSLQPLYSKLSFDSKTSPRLQTEGGHPNAQQLQAIRQLTSKSAESILAL